MINDFKFATFFGIILCMPFYWNVEESGAFLAVLFIVLVTVLGVSLDPKQENNTKSEKEVNRARL